MSCGIQHWPCLAVASDKSVVKKIANNGYVGGSADWLGDRAHDKRRARQHKQLLCGGKGALRLV